MSILADNIFKCIFLNENDRIPIQISLKFVPRSPIDIKALLFEVMVWCRTGQAITQINDDPDHWCIYAILGGNELTIQWYLLTCLKSFNPLKPGDTQVSELGNHWFML